MSFLLFTISAFAVYRLSLLVSKEDGPAWIFQKLRRLPPPRSSARQGLSCQLCCSVYASAAVTSFICWRGYCLWIDWPLYWLAASAAAICLHMTFTKDI